MNWPETNPEVEDVEFDALTKPDGWVHACPVLSHRGVVIPFEIPEEAEPEPEPDEEDPEPDEPDEKKDQDGDQNNDGDQGDGEVKEPVKTAQ